MKYSLVFIVCLSMSIFLKVESMPTAAEKSTSYTVTLKRHLENDCGNVSDGYSVPCEACYSVMVKEETVEKEKSYKVQVEYDESWQSMSAFIIPNEKQSSKIVLRWKLSNEKKELFSFQKWKGITKDPKNITAENITVEEITENKVDMLITCGLKAVVKDFCDTYLKTQFS